MCWTSHACSYEDEDCLTDGQLASFCNFSILQNLLIPHTRSDAINFHILTQTGQCGITFIDSTSATVACARDSIASSGDTV